jgi:hypothetical protein
MTVILITRWKRMTASLHDNIIVWQHHCMSASFHSKAWVRNTSLTPPLLIEATVSSQESEWSCICVLGVSNLSGSFYDFDI